MNVDLSFQHTMLLSSVSSLDLTECLIHHHGVLHSIVSDQQTVNKCVDEPMFMEFTDLIVFPAVLKQLA